MWIDDNIIRPCLNQSIYIEAFRPEQPLIVLGSGNEAIREIKAEAIRAMEVPILKRYGGGGTVVLYPGCAILSIGAWVDRCFENNMYFDVIHGCLLDFLRQTSSLLGFEAQSFSQQGLSDLCWMDRESNWRKFAGTSLFRSKNFLLYQASLIVDLDLNLIDRLLLHPSREPAYRSGRSHKSFLVGLAEVFPLLSAQRFTEMLSKTAKPMLEEAFRKHLIDPQETQKKNLIHRLEGPHE